MVEAVWLGLALDVQYERERKEQNMKWNMDIINAVSTVDGTDIMNRVCVYRVRMTYSTSKRRGWCRIRNRRRVRRIHPLRPIVQSQRRANPPSPRPLCGSRLFSPLFLEPTAALKLPPPRQQKGLRFLQWLGAIHTQSIVVMTLRRLECVHTLLLLVVLR